MNLLALIIVAAAAGAIGNGFRRGFTLAAFSYGGLVAGTAVGAFMAPLFARVLAPGSELGPFIGLGILLIVAAVGSSIGYAFGEPLRLKLLMTPRGGRIDSALGAGFSVFSVLATSWFLGLVFARGPIQPVAQEIRGSAILRAMDAAFPRPPSFLAGVEQVIAGVPYPKVFDAIANPDLPGPVQVDPAIGNNPQVVQAAREVVKIRSFGCGGEVFGSGYPVADGYLISNAHVVAGTSDHTIFTPDGRSLRATVVLYDPERDVSILRVPGLGLAPLPEASSAARRGESGATIGYPGGGPEHIDAAAVRTEVTAVGRDIYGTNEVARRIYVLTANIHPGNSGGPLVDAGGQVLGLVFANSTSDPSEGYALTDSEVQPDIAAGVGRTGGVSTESCAS